MLVKISTPAFDLPRSQMCHGIKGSSTTLLVYSNVCGLAGDLGEPFDVEGGKMPSMCVRSMRHCLSDSAI